MNQENAVIFDLDGTLCDDSLRRPLLNEGGWSRYYENVKNDPPIQETVSFARTLMRDGCRLIFVTGRPESTRSDTEYWLRSHIIGPFDELTLFMRRNDEFALTEVRLKEGFAQRVRSSCRIKLAVDCRKEVVDAYRKLGISAWLADEKTYPSYDPQNAPEGKEVIVSLEEMPRPVWQIRSKADYAGFQKFGLLWTRIRGELLTHFNKVRATANYVVITHDGERYLCSKGLLAYKTFYPGEKEYTRIPSGDCRLIHNADDAPIAPPADGYYWLFSDAWEPVAGKYRAKDLRAKICTATFSEGAWTPPVSKFKARMSSVVERYVPTDFFPRLPRLNNEPIRADREEIERIKSSLETMNITRTVRDGLLRALDCCDSELKFTHKAFRGEIRDENENLLHPPMPVKQSQHWLREMTRLGCIEHRLRDSTIVREIFPKS